MEEAGTPGSVVPTPSPQAMPPAGREAADVSGWLAPGGIRPILPAGSIRLATLAPSVAAAALGLALFHVGLVAAGPPGHEPILLASAVSFAFAFGLGGLRRPIAALILAFPTLMVIPWVDHGIGSLPGPMIVGGWLLGAAAHLVRRLAGRAPGAAR
jgi:hypothetical protein